MGTGFVYFRFDAKSKLILPSKSLAKAISTRRGNQESRSQFQLRRRGCRLQHFLTASPTPDLTQSLRFPRRPWKEGLGPSSVISAALSLPDKAARPSEVPPRSRREALA